MLNRSSTPPAGGRGRIGIAALIVPALLSMGYGINTEELVCEDALAKLASCCPDFHPERVSCRYVNNSTGGCDSGRTDVTYPTLREAESRCLIALDCEAIVDGRLCPMVQALTPDRDFDANNADNNCFWSCTDPTPYTETRHDPVCR